MKTILLKFAGPLQSWGTNSHFETRHTDFYPSKSAVIGLISASLGYKRIEDDKIQKLNELNFAVRIDQEGNLLRDYHTARKFDNKGKFIRTYVTNRYYLEDAIFIVGISHEDNAFMEMIENSLKSPYFQPYMGRRSLPVLSQLIFEVNNMGLLESIKNCDWQAAKWYKRKYKENKEVDLEIYLDNCLINSKYTNLRKDKVISFSQKNRKFGYRYEARYSVKVKNELWKDYAIEKQTEHDVFSVLGE